MSIYGHLDNRIIELLQEDVYNYTSIAKRVCHEYDLDMTNVDKIRRHVGRVAAVLADDSDFPDHNRQSDVFEEYKRDETKDKAMVTVSTDRQIRTLEEALHLADVDLEVWDVERWLINAWPQKPNEKQMYQVKVWLKKKDVDEFNVMDVADRLRDIIKSDIYYPDIIQRDETTNHMLEICVFDLHLGKLAWESETGENYNLKIAEQRFMAAIIDIVKKAAWSNPDRILFCVGNDFFNSDRAHPFPSTTRGTPQQDDTRWQKIFLTGVSVLIEAIDYMSTICDVDVVVVPGNHDFERSFYAGVALSERYINNTSVTIDNQPATRKYYQYGRCLIGLTHGNEEKLNDLPMIMASEVPDLWANTYYREFHLGHLHHKRLNGKKTYIEAKGVTSRNMISLNGKDESTVQVRHISSVTAPDAWHSKKGFIGSLQSAEGFIWNLTDGLIGTVIHNVK